MRAFEIDIQAQNLFEPAGARAARSRESVAVALDRAGRVGPTVLLLHQESRVILQHVQERLQSVGRPALDKPEETLIELLRLVGRFLIDKSAGERGYLPGNLIAINGMPSGIHRLQGKAEGLVEVSPVGRGLRLLEVLPDKDLSGRCRLGGRLLLHSGALVFVSALRLA